MTTVGCTVRCNFSDNIAASSKAVADEPPIAKKSTSSLESARLSTRHMHSTTNRTMSPAGLAVTARVCKVCSSTAHDTNAARSSFPCELMGSADTVMKRSGIQSREIRFDSRERNAGCDGKSETDAFRTTKATRHSGPMPKSLSAGRISFRTTTAASANKCPHHLQSILISASSLR